MNADAQRIAIAETCGWKLVDLPNHPNGHKVLWKTPDGKQLSTGTIHSLPDYLADLNAMHEAEKVLTIDQIPQYSHELQDIVRRIVKDGRYIGYFTIHATAAQRAEAFLRTIGKWTDS